jgi:2-haloacid dehalogenase
LESSDGGDASNLPSQVRQAAYALDGDGWQCFAQEWRNSYWGFTRGFDPATHAFTTVDEHHYNSLKMLLKQWGLEGLWAEPEIKDLSLCWHFLNPWADSVRGIEKLNAKFTTCTLSNANSSLLGYLVRHGSLPFRHVFSAEQFGAYKPSPLVYNGAAKQLHLEAKDCALVAAHLADLKAARECGYQTVYVVRPKEEGYTDAEALAAKEEGWVDMWIDASEQGFLEIARRFGL